MSLNIARMAVSAATFAIDKPYDYLIPDEMIGKAVRGMRALVPFGRGNKKCVAVILSLANGSGYEKLKAIDTLLDDASVLDEENVKLALWMSDRFFCTVFDALRVMLPAGMWFKNGAQRLGDKTVGAAVLNQGVEETLEAAAGKRKSAPKQAAILELLAKAGAMSVKDICFYSGYSEAPVRALEKQGLLSIKQREVYRRPSVMPGPDVGEIVLNEEQSRVLEGILPLMKNGAPEAALLFGVTGSGKTLVYIKLIEEAISFGKTTIVLVPEISLTPQIVSVFTSYFGDRVAVLHSGLGLGERNDEWKRIRSGCVRVVIGTRSAVFAPLADIGLIIIDEEQEHTYKSDNSPRYHARDVAKYRVSRFGALLLLASATPSIESMFNAKAGKYKLFRIPHRYNEKALPPVIIADMKREIKSANAGSISSVLLYELKKNIDAGQQSILFLNRRGTHPLVTCGECGYTFKCRHCSVSMTFHSSNESLLCHYCGFTQKLPQDCPQCHGRLKFVGAGTQKVENELHELLPGVRIIRMDADTVGKVNAHAEMLSRFKDGKAQILLGTQMVTKGLDFENVTLVGVVSADMSLYMSDYRAHERTFSLITQVVGRSGRGEKPGRAVIQTFTPGHDVITLASKQDYDSFYNREIELREILGSPPIRDLMSIVITGADESNLQEACRKLRGLLDSYFRGDKGIGLLGPAPATVQKISGRYRYRLLVSCRNSRAVRDTIAHTLRGFCKDKASRGISVYADADVVD